MDERQLAPTVRVAAFVIAVSLPWAASAQTASQITPPSFSPVIQSQGGGFVIPEGQGVAPPPGAEKLTVRLHGVAIQGGLPALAEAAAALRKRLSGKLVTAADLFAAAGDLERAYAGAGYPLVRVVLPAQRLRHGADLRLLVIDGIIERIDVSTLPAEIRERIAAVLAPLVQAPGLTQAALERRLLIASDSPGTILRSTLAPGASAGASVLVVEARYKAVTGSTGVDNSLSKALGRDNASVGFEFNSPTGHGETLYLRASGLPLMGGGAAFLGDDPRNRGLAVGFILPMGTDGLSLTLEATDARTAAHADTGTAGFSSEFSRYSARLRYPVLRGRDFTLNAEGSFDAQEERVSFRVPVQAPFSLDRLRILRGGGDAQWFLPQGWLGEWSSGGAVTGRLIGSVGIDGLGARDAPPTGSHLPGLSRLGARPEFQKLEALVSLTQPLAEHLTLSMTARGQTSFNQALPRSEQIGLAAPTGLSSFDSGLFQGDEGVVLRGEVQAPFAVPVSLPFAWPSVPALQGSVPVAGDVTDMALMLTPYGFGAFGLTRQQRVTVLERPVVRGSAYGAGLRFGAAPGQSFSNLAVNLEYAHGERSGRLPGDDRFNASMTVQF